MLSLSIVLSGLFFTSISPNIARADIPIVYPECTPETPTFTICNQTGLFDWSTDWSIGDFQLSVDLFGVSVSIAAGFSGLGAF